MNKKNRSTLVITVLGLALFSMTPQNVEIKRDVVEQDEFDKGMRGLLNFGHTFGHAIEKLSGL